MTRKNDRGRHPSDLFSGQPERQPAPRLQPKQPIPTCGLQGVPVGPATSPLVAASSVGSRRADHSPAANARSLAETQAAADWYGGPMPS